MRLKNLPVAYKLWGVVLGAMLFMLGLAFVLTAISEQRAQQVQQKTEQADMRIATTMRWMALAEVTVERVVVSAMSFEMQLVEEMSTLSAKGLAEMGELQKQVAVLAESTEEKMQLARGEAHREQVIASVARIKQSREMGDTLHAMEVASKELRPAVAVYLQSQADLLQLQEAMRSTLREEASVQRQQGYMITAGVCLVVVLLGVLLVGVIVRSITRPLDRAVHLADTIAAGDLSLDVHDDRKDELGRLLRSLSEMTQKLRTLVGEVRGGVESVSSAAVQIASGNQDLSSRTEQTAANLEQTAASLEELTATVTQSAETSRQANQLAITAVQAAERGGAVVQQVVQSMAEINQSSRKISDIIGVIDGIAFQTNILALNAAVEAARAGEQGRGFAVVAGEVRSLAQRSAEAAKEIKALITTSVGNVDTGSAQVALAGESMQEIVTSVRRVTDLIAEISAAATEQNQGFAQLNQAVSNLDQMTQQNAALVEESSAAAMSLSEQAQRLEEVLAVFQTGLPSAQVLGARQPLSPASRSITPAAVERTLQSTPISAASTSTKRVAAPQSSVKTSHKPVAKVSEDDWESF